MRRERQEKRTCAVCAREFPAREVVPAEAVGGNVASLIAAAAPAWGPEAYVCREDLARFRQQYVHGLLASEKGELSDLEQEVLDSLRDNEIIATNVDEELEARRTLGQVLADKLASFGGSWGFLICFALFLLAWIAVNSFVLLERPVDPYPFILLNLMLSCLAAIQAPVIMMSQNRQEAKDRERSQNDYQVNLKAELEIRRLQEKVDHLLMHQWPRLVEIQEVQVELLSDLGRSGGR
jgi:uncharacterized membrane protein